MNRVYVTVVRQVDRGVVSEFAAYDSVWWCLAWFAGLSLVVTDLLFVVRPRARDWYVQQQIDGRPVGR